MWNLCSGNTLGEAIRLLDRLRQRHRLVTLRVAEAAGIEDIRAHP